MTIEIVEEIAKEYNTNITEYSERVIKAINKKDGYCPCVAVKK